MRIPILRHIVFFLVSACLWASAANGAPANDAPYAQALKSYREGRWANAFGQFCDLASEGDADSARICLFMHAYGPVLYGSHWDAASDDLDHWKSLAARGRQRPQPTFVPIQYPAPPRSKNITTGARAVAKNISASQQLFRRTASLP